MSGSVAIVRMLACGLVLWAGAAACPRAGGEHGRHDRRAGGRAAARSQGGRGGWSQAATVTLPWDVRTSVRRPSRPPPASRPTATNIYVRIEAQQREPLLAQQRTNDVGEGTDDEVWIDLWPGGSAGFGYQFAATSNGTHFQYSSENTAYAPTWESSGSARGGGFTMTMRIPLRALRGNGGGNWKAQLARVVRSTGERQIWSDRPAQTNGDDVTFAGALSGLVGDRPGPARGSRSTAWAPRARRAAGLTTSRMGGDSRFR